MVREVFESGGRAMLATFVTLISFVFIPGGGLNFHQAVLMASFAGIINMLRRITLLELEGIDNALVN
jgi:hypothetical protein